MLTGRSREDYVLDFSGKNDFADEAASVVPVMGTSVGQKAVERGVGAFKAEAMRKAFSEGPLDDRVRQMIAV